MQLIDMSHNDDVVSLARKCNTNFKRLAALASEVTNRQGADTAGIEGDIETLQEDVGTVSEATMQLADRVSAVEGVVLPPIYSCLIMTTDPAEYYTGTTWTNRGPIQDGNGNTWGVWQRQS